MIRVAFFLHYKALYGANRSFLNLIDGLEQYDVKPFAIVPSFGDISEQLEQRGIPVLQCPIQWWMAPEPVSRNEKLSRRGAVVQILRSRRAAFRRIYRNVRLLPRLSKQLLEWKVDVVYTNSAVTPAGAMAAYWAGIPHIWQLREFGDLDYGLSCDWGSMVCRAAIKRSDAAIAVSSAVARHHGGTGLVIYNAVASEEQFDALRSDSLERANSYPNAVFIFAIIGLVTESKGQEIAIRALAMLGSEEGAVKLIVVGKGETDGPKQLAIELGVADKVEFWGHVSDPFQAFLSADAILMCSRNEAMGRVTVEAMAACRPVIGFDNAGTAELIRHEFNGLLYRGGAVELAACMKRLLENRDWARAMGQRGWSWARTKFTEEAYSKSVYEVMRNVAAKGGGA